MTSDRKVLDAKYRQSRKDKGYIRIHKWIPTDFKTTIYPIIDLLACHYEDSESTTDFHDFIRDLQRVAKKIEEEYGVQND